MEITAQQKKAIELLNQAIEKIVELGECDAGHAAINAIDRAKDKIFWGDFEKKEAVIPKEKVLLARHEFEFWKKRGDKKWALKKMEIKTGVTEEQFFAGLKEYGL